jgi:histone acetyltransferase
MEHKLETNQYTSLNFFVDDAALVFSNCRLYNPEASIYHRNATKLDKYLRDQVEEYTRCGG